MGALGKAENPLAGLIGGFFIGLLLENLLKYEGRRRSWNEEIPPLAEG